jgi:cellulose biosynthesis protein BcsQ
MHHAADLGQVITFYSYKGGTGRSMAVANVACVLADLSSTRRGVLVLDGDLEAPGLHRYFRKYITGPIKSHSELDRHPGLIDLFIRLDEAVRASNDGEDISSPRGAQKVVAQVPIDEYILDTDHSRLKLIKAGRFDASYGRRVNDFSWSTLYDQAPWIFSAFATSLAERFDYVLIDSRTGVTDTAGVCTMLLPEKLVVVFTPNEQSMTGINDRIRQALRYRRRSDDLRPLLAFPLPSRIEAAEPELREKWRYGSSADGLQGYQELFELTFKEAYGLRECDLGGYFDEVQVQHVPRFAYGEEIAWRVERTSDRLSVARSYETFAERLVRPDGPWDQTNPKAAETPKCFVIMPFGTKPHAHGSIIDFDYVYRELVAPAVQRAGLEAVRADEEMFGPVNNQTVFERLVTSDVVVADLTTTSPNVMYELGIRHALRPRNTVLLADSGTRIPFDISASDVERYEWGVQDTLGNLRKAGDRLTTRLLTARRSERPDSPLFLTLPWLTAASAPVDSYVFRERAGYVSRLKARLATARADGLDRVLDMARELEPIADQDAAVVIDLFLSFRAL